MLTSQMFTFMSGCLGQLFQQSGLQLPQPPTTAELQADPTAPLPPAGGFLNVPLSTFPQTPLLQIGAFAVPQTTTPQAAVTTSFLAQLQMTTPASSQLVSPLTTGALVSRHQLTPLCLVHRDLHRFRRLLHRGQRGWDRRTTTFERSRSRSRQLLPLTLFLLLPRLLQLPAR
jgi:hypothetical protein